MFIFGPKQYKYKWLIQKVKYEDNFWCSSFGVKSNLTSTMDLIKTKVICLT